MYNTEVHSSNHCCCQKAVSTKYYEHVFALLPSLSGVQIMSFLHRIIMSSVTCLALWHLPTLSHKWHFPKNFIEPRTCVLIFSATFVRKISHSEKNSAQYYHKCTYYSCQILIKLNFLDRFWKNPQIPNIKISWQMVHAVRQTWQS
jgi:hypothetical protein